ARARTAAPTAPRAPECSSPGRAPWPRTHRPRRSSTAGTSSSGFPLRLHRRQSLRLEHARGAPVQSIDEHDALRLLLAGLALRIGNPDAILVRHHRPPALTDTRDTRSSGSNPVAKAHSVARFTVPTSSPFLSNRTSISPSTPALSNVL